ncbi:sensor histidine kinase [Aminipila sp.]|uniref:sensor histidine kinase n=1 Tax=Aminipila sp. TaxID=2060095 RepID=UPI0028991AA3|nr:HAMP domain-containing sensor histidine kinase [Aminipila sp.]
MSKIQMILTICSFLVTCICLIRNWKIKRDIYKFTDALDQCIEEMILGKEEIFFDEMGENVLSRLQTKLKRLYEIQRKYSQQNFEEKNKMQALVSDISHQTKTPIANIIMYIEILKNRKNEPEKEAEFLNLVDAQVRKLDFLIQAMLKMSRLETGILSIEKKQCSLYETIGNVLAVLQPKADKKKIQVSVTCPKELAISHDRKWTEEAIFNILDNAVKYTERGGQIHLLVAPQEFYIKISIRDNGKGIEEANQGRVFQRFYREEDAHEQEGVGIGLYLAREIITRQQGYIEVKSQKGKGSEFRIYLPR